MFASLSLSLLVWSIALLCFTCLPYLLSSFFVVGRSNVFLIQLHLGQDGSDTAVELSPLGT